MFATRSKISYIRHVMCIVLLLFNVCVMFFRFIYDSSSLMKNRFLRYVVYCDSSYLWYQVIVHTKLIPNDFKACSLSENHKIHQLILERMCPQHSPGGQVLPNWKQKITINLPFFIFLAVTEMSKNCLLVAYIIQLSRINEKLFMLSRPQGQIIDLKCEKSQ